MNKELILKLIERARASSENAYCPYSNTPMGCSLLVDDNIVLGGCNVENGVLSASVDAGEVAIFKAISEGYTKFRAICFWSEEKMPYPSGRTRQLLAEFNKNLNMIIATGTADVSYSIATLADLFPFPPEATIE